MTNRAAAFVAGAMNYLRVIGPDAVSVLDLLTPKDMTKLKVGHGTFVLFTTPAGTIDNEAVVLRTAEDEFLLSCGGPTKSPSWLPEALEVHSRARVEQAGVACFNIKGPLRLAAMSRLVHPDDAPKILDLGIFGACPARTPEGRPVWVLRTTIGVEMWGDGAALRQSWVRILDMPDLVTPCGWDLLDIFRVECEDMIFGVYPIELHGGTTLWEAGYAWMAGSPKPRNYIGRAALQEAALAGRSGLAGQFGRRAVSGRRGLHEGRRVRWLRNDRGVLAQASTTPGLRPPQALVPAGAVARGRRRRMDGGEVAVRPASHRCG